MPLLKGKNKKECSEVEKEEKAGPKKNIAIAYSMKKKKMASGGTVSSGDPTMNYAEGGSVDPMMEVECPSCNHKFSHGGMVANDDEPLADSMPANFDDLALRDGLEEHYTAENSGDGDGAPDVVKRAMKKKKND